VIEHLQMMEREAILTCQTDDRRRKYYYLANDILVEVSLKHPGSGEDRGMAADTAGPAPESRRSPAAGAEQARRRQIDENNRLKNAVGMLARMIQAHDRLADNLEELNHDIETKISDIARIHNDIFRDERES